MLSDKKDNQKAIIVNQSIAEDAADVRHDIGEATADNRCDHITNQISKKAWLIIGCILGATLVLGGNSIRMHYSWSSDLDNAHNSFQESNARNRDLALEYHNQRRETEEGLRDQIDKLVIEQEEITKERDHLHQDTHVLAEKFVRERTKFETAESQTKALEQEVAELKRAKEGMRKRLQQGSDTLNTLATVINDERKKYLKAKETNLICVGAANNDVAYFHKAETYQSERTGRPFDIRLWENINTLASVVIRLGASDCAKYMIGKEGWRDVVDVELHEFLESVAADKNPTPIIIPLKDAYKLNDPRPDLVPAP